MTKKNPVYLTVLLVALSITITFMTTFVLTKAYSEDKQTQGIPSSMIEDVLPQKTLEKIREIALYYAALYPDKVNTEDIEKYLIASIIAGAGDTFGNYVSAQELDS